MLTKYQKRTVAEHRQVYKNEVENGFKQIHKGYLHFYLPFYPNGLSTAWIWQKPWLRENIAEEGPF